MHPSDPHSVPTPARRAPNFGLLIALTALGPLSLHVFLPSMPGLERTFHTSPSTVQLVFTAYLTALACAQLVLGPLSDRFGRRPVMIAGIALFVGGTLFGLMAPSIGSLIAARILQAVGSCAGLVLGRAMVRDVYGRERATEAIAYLTMAMVVVPMLSPGVGGLLDERYGWHANFYLMLGYGAIGLALSFPYLHETHHDRPEGGGIGFQNMLYNFAVLLKIARFRGFMINVGCSVAAFFTFAGNAPRLSVALYHLTPLQYGLCFVSISFAFMVGNFGAARYSRKLGGEWLMLMGGLLGVVSLVIMLILALAGALTPWGLFGAASVMAFGNGFSLPNGTAMAVGIDPARAGSASGLLGFFQMGLGALTSFLVTKIADGGLEALAFMMAALAIVSVSAQVLWAGIPERPRRSVPT